jgi:PAS domain S-box-containing protein
LLRRNFGKRLRALRTAKHLTQALLAEAAGISVPYLSNIERGLASPSFDVIARFCHALGVEPATLFIFSQEEPAADMRPPSRPGRYVTLTAHWKHTLDTGELYWSPSLYAILGLTPQSTPPSLELFLEHVHPGDRDMVRQAYQDLVQGRDLSVTEFRLGEGNGVERRLLARAEISLGPDGPVVHGLLMEVTEWRRLELELLRTRDALEADMGQCSATLDKTVATLEAEAEIRRKTEERLRLYKRVVSACSDAMAFLDTDLVYQVANPQYEHLWGVSRVDIEGRSVRDLMGGHPLWETVRGHLHDALMGRKARFQITYPFPGAGERCLDVTYMPYWEQGRVLGVVTALRDITSLARTQEALQASEKRFRTAVEHMPVLVNAMDENLLFVFWNRECARVTGYAGEEIVGNPRAWELLYPDREQREAILRRLRRGPAPDRNPPCTLTARDGTPRHISWSQLSRSCPVPGWHFWAVGLEIPRDR